MSKYLRPRLATMDSFTLSQFTTYVRRILALNLAQPVWITAEVAQVSESRGHHYLTLIEKNDADDEIKARVDAVLWSGRLRQLKRERGAAISGVLRAGLSVRLRVLPEFHDRFGFKLIVEDADSNYTLGVLEAARQETLERLRRAGLLDRQAAISFPALPRRVAVISSEGAAGYADFRRQLLDNPAAYDFTPTLFPASVQGENAPTEIKQALDRIQRRAHDFDLVVIVRGGGARLDLLAFDDEKLCRAVAAFPLPVLTGVGHDTDSALLDHVAYRALKTPTAVAEYLLNHYDALDDRLNRLKTEFQRLARHRIAGEEVRLERLRAGVGAAVLERTRFATARLERHATVIPLLANARLAQHRGRIDRLEGELAAYDLKGILSRGFALVSQNGRYVTRVADLKTGKITHIRFQDGVIKC